MKPIKFDTETRSKIESRLQQYFETELDQPLGQFEAGFLLDFISKELGSYYYNLGIQDAQAMLRMKTEDLVDALMDLEQPEPR